MLVSKSDSEGESLSALSEVDESFLDGADRWQDELRSPKKLVGRPRTLKPNGVDARDKTHGRTALHKAAARGNLEKMKDLIGVRGASIDITDNAGVTALHDACTAGHIEAVRYLINAGAAVSPKDCEGDYPLLDAAQNDNEQICQILLDAGANPTMQNSRGMSALSEAEEGPLKDLLRQYSSRFDSPGQNCMRITDVLTLDDTPRGGDNLQDKARRRATRLKSNRAGAQGAREVDINGRDQLHQYTLKEDDDLVEQYLEFQDCDHEDNYGDTPLHAASRLGNAHICGLLLQHGAKVNARNKKGNTPLHEAAHTRGSRDVMIALLDAGASSLTRNQMNQLPSEVATNELGIESAEARLLQKTVSKEREKAENKARKRAARKERNGSTSESAKSTPIQSPRVLRQRQVTEPNSVAAEHVNAVEPDTSRPEPRAPVSGDVAILVASSAPPEIVSTTKQIASSGLPTTQFLTELKSNRFLSHIDSSVRGSPLPPAPKHSPGPPPSSSGQTSSTRQVTAEEVPALEPTMTNASPNSLKRTAESDCGTSQAPSSPKRFKAVDATPEAPHASSSGKSHTNGVSESSSRDQTAVAVADMSRDIVAAIEKQNTLLASMLQSINALVSARQQ